METIVDINDYTSEKRCVYKDRIYFVRDNGAVYRQAKSGQPVRKNDEEWTFGKPDKTSRYLMIGSERVHRIVCTAFHGEPIGDRNIADHIDTNRHNNRPENLHWVTKLENAIGNPITRAMTHLEEEMEGFRAYLYVNTRMCLCVNTRTHKYADTYTR